MGVRRRVDRLAVVAVARRCVEVFSHVFAVVLADKRLDDAREFMLVGNSQTVGDVANHDFCALFGCNQLVRVHVVLVFGEESRIFHLADVVI